MQSEHMNNEFLVCFSRPFSHFLGCTMELSQSYIVHSKRGRREAETAGG